MKLDIRVGLMKTCADFCKNSSIGSFNYIVEKSRNVFERFLWFSFNIALVTVTIFLFINTQSELFLNPTVTSLQSTNFPVENVDFPAVSICNVNKISLAQAKIHAEYLHNLTGYSYEMFMEGFQFLGRHINYNDLDITKILQFQKIMISIHKKFSVFNPTEIFRKLTPSCEEMLETCHWGNELVNCSEYFALRLTYDGLCCIFNYVKPYGLTLTNSSNILNEPLKQKQGYRYGLKVVINNHPEDYYLTTFSSVGIRLQVFSPRDYPDKSSGSLSDILVNMGTETFISVKSTIFSSLDSIKSLPLHKRKCIFPIEKQTQFGNYSESDCLVECKVTSVLSLCNCVPFLIPVYDRRYICSFNELQCLSHYKEKWNTIIPLDVEAIDGLEKELEIGLRCSTACYAACEYIKYKTEVNSAPIDSEDFVNKTVLYVYNSDQFVHVYVQDVVFYWFEILSTFGGLLGVTLGLSLISVIELIFYFTLNFLKNSIN